MSAFMQINPYIVCKTVKLFRQVDTFVSSFQNQIFDPPSGTSDKFSFYDIDAEERVDYSTKDSCVECLDCQWYDGNTNLPVGENPVTYPSFELYSKVDIFTSLTKKPYRTWENVRMENTDSLITIYSEDESKILAYYTKNIDAGAFLASGTK